MSGQNEHLPSSVARRSLASRFGLPYFADMQDREWEVADPERFQEFLDAYVHENLTEAERISLMEILLQCVEESRPAESMQVRWKQVEPHLTAHFTLHHDTIEYWSCLGAESPDECFHITPRMRSVRGCMKMTPNPSLHPKCYSGLRPLTHSGELQR